MKTKTSHRTFAAISLMATAFYVAAPGLAHAGNVTSTHHGSSAPATDSTATSDSTSVDDGTSSDPFGSIFDDGSADTTDSASTDPADATSGSSTTAPKDDGIFSKIGDFFTKLTTALQPVLEFLTMINSYTHIFDGILGSGFGGVGGANGPMGGTSGTGTNGGTVGSNTGRNSPTTVPSTNPNTGSHVGTSATNGNGTHGTVATAPGRIGHPAVHAVGTVHSVSTTGHRVSATDMKNMFRGPGAGVRR